MRRPGRLAAEEFPFWLSKNGKSCRKMSEELTMPLIKAARVKSE